MWSIQCSASLRESFKGCRIASRKWHWSRCVRLLSQGTAVSVDKQLPVVDAPAGPRSSDASSPKISGQNLLDSGSETAPDNVFNRGCQINNDWNRVGKSVWRRMSPSLACILAGYGAYATFTCYRAEWDLRRTWLRITLHHQRLAYRFWHHIMDSAEPAERLERQRIAEINSGLKTSLDGELMQLLTAYFLQLDLDKENGVRRSDVLCFLKECGLNDPEALPDVRAFLEQGSGSPAMRRQAGCSFQEMTDLLEVLLNDVGRRTGIPSEDPKILRREAVLRHLKHQTCGMLTGGTLPVFSNALWTSSECRAHQSPPSEREEDPVSEQKILLLQDIERHRRLQSKLLELQKRSGLSSAQEQRLRDIEMEIMRLENVVNRLRREKSITVTLRALASKALPSPSSPGQ